MAAFSAPAALPAAAQVASPDERRAEVRRQQGEVAGRLDSLRASDADVTAALDVLTADVAAQRDRLADARRIAADAGGALETAQREEQSAQGELGALDGELRRLAVDAYVRPPSDNDAGAMLTGSPLEAPKRRALARFRTRSLDDTLDQLRAKREDLQRARARAETARQAAEQAQNTESTRLADLEAAAERQRGVVADVEDRLDRALGEAAALADRDRALAAEIEQRQAALAAQVEAARRQAATEAPSTPPAWGSVRAGGNVTVVSVRGIEVSAEIAGQVAALLAAADGDGVTLDGSGYRSTDEQIQIRREVCGTSDYAIWEMPSSECSPPVARPGRSMHEKGLAIDFIAGGDLIRSRATAEYRWLEANAERFGLYNLPSEPWHWSTTGS